MGGFSSEVKRSVASHDDEKPPIGGPLRLGVAGVTRSYSASA